MDEILKNSLKSRRAFQNTLNDKSAPGPVRKLQIIANFILFFFIALAIIENSIVRNEYNSLASSFIVIQKSYQILSVLQESVYYTRSLVFSAQGIATNMT